MIIRLLITLLFTQYAFSQEITHVIFDRNGSAVDGSNAVISEDGRYIAFTSSSNNIVEGDSNFINRGPDERGNAADVFLFDREKNEYQRVSLTHDGKQIEDGESLLLSASNNLDYLLYYSVGISQFPNDTRIADWDYDIDLYLYDNLAKQTTWLTVSPDGQEADFETSIGDLSGNGRFAVVYTLSSNLLDDTVPYNSEHQFILLDTETNERILVSQNINGIQQNASHNRNRSGIAINYDGSDIFFFSYATNLTIDGVGGLFLWDRETKTNELISKTPDGAAIEFEFLFEPRNLELSDDGRYLFFISTSNQHVTNDPHPDNKLGNDGFIYDRITKKTKVIPLGDFDSPNRQNGAQIGFISGNGRYVVFCTRETDGSYREMFLYDQQTETVELLLSAESNHPLIPNPNIGLHSISSDGKYILFSSGVLYLLTREVNTSHVDAWDAVD